MDSQVGGSRRRSHLWTVAAVVTIVLLAGAVAGFAVSAASSTSPASSATSSCSATTVADDVLPSIVTIEVAGGAGSGTGSGEIIRSDGYILTNNHVVASAARSGAIRVVFSDGSTASATIKGRDPQTDLAVVKVDTNRSLPTVHFGSSGDVRVGQQVVVLGAPLGLSSTVTAGIVSALDRTIEVPAENGATALLVSAIQTDAAINPGNSGGAMTDCSGELIGIPTAGASVPSSSGESSGGSVGLGFAIPSDFAKSVSDEIISTGTVTHSAFGIEVAQIPPVAAQRAGTSEGLFVNRVVSGGPSADAGLRSGDIITKIDGQQAASPNQLAALTLTKKPGDTVGITYERGGTEHTTTITLGTQPLSAAASS